MTFVSLFDKQKCMASSVEHVLVLQVSLSNWCLSIICRLISLFTWFFQEHLFSDVLVGMMINEIQVNGPLLVSDLSEQSN